MLKGCNHKVKILADKGYDFGPLHKLPREKGSILIATVRKKWRKKPKGSNRKRCAKGDTQYFKRNIVESIFHSLKAVRVHASQGKKYFMKKRETALYVLVDNIERMNKTLVLFILVLKDLFWIRPIIQKLFK